MAGKTSIHLRGKLAAHASFVNVTGEIEASTARAFRDQLFGGLAPDTKYLIVRLKHVEYMDSSGIAVLLEVFSEARRRGVKLVLLEPSAAVERALAIVDFAALTSVYSNVRECAECTGVGIERIRSGLALHEREVFDGGSGRAVSESSISSSPSALEEPRG